MVETLHLLPPGTGLRSDPVLFGVAEALARLFPVEESLAPAEEVPPAPSRHGPDDGTCEDGPDA